MAVRNTLRTSRGVRTMFVQSERGYSVRTGCTYVRVRTMFVQSEHTYRVYRAYVTGCTYAVRPIRARYSNEYIGPSPLTHCAPPRCTTLHHPKKKG